MQQSRRELLDDCLTKRNALGDSGQRTLAALYLNRAYMDVWMAHPWTDLRLPNPIQITTIASTRAYVLPSYFGRIPPGVKVLVNLTTGRKIAIASIDRITEEFPDSGTSLEQAGTPQFAAVSGMVGVSVQPSSSGQALEVLSSDASDTDVRVLVEGVNSSGDWDETQVTLNGLTAVAIGTWKTPLVTFSKSYPAGTDPATALTSSRGTVTLRTVAGASTLQQLLPEESAREFPSLILSPKPVTASEVIGVPCIRAPKRLLYDADMCPRYWGSAILERMDQLWDQGAEGDTRTPLVYGPQLVALVSLDNSSRPERIIKRPSRG